jgi:hypothetical protein
VSTRSLVLVIGLALANLFLAACGTAQPSPAPAQPTPVPTQPEVIEPTCTRQPIPRIIEHPEPTLAADIRIIRTDYAEGDSCIRIDGFLNPECVQARVTQGGVSQIITSQEELRDWFSPIESADEALSYALLATGYTAKYAPEDYRLAVGEICDPGPEHYRYYTDVLEDTHVVKVINGYHVNLFYSENVGCGPFPVSSVTVEVAFDGAISEFPMIRLFEQDEPCPGEEMVQCCID